MRIKALEVAGFSSALRGMRNPMNSWDKSDSYYNNIGRYEIGENDLGLAKRLIQGGSEHRKYLRQIKVWMDIDVPRFIWSEFDTYKVGTTANSCSTMHRLLHETTSIDKNLFTYHGEDEDIMELVIKRLNEIRELYLKSKDSKLIHRAKCLLTEGFLQLRTFETNYETLMNMYHQRKNHRLPEWHVFCAFLESLPYFVKLCLNGERKFTNENGIVLNPEHNLDKL